MALDVTDEKAQENIVKVAVEKFGGLHIAFNNAGIVSAPHSHRLPMTDCTALHLTVAIVPYWVDMGAED